MNRIQCSEEKLLLDGKLKSRETNKAFSLVQDGKETAVDIKLYSSKFQTFHTHTHTQVIVKIKQLVYQHIRNLTSHINHTNIHLRPHPVVVKTRKMGGVVVATKTAVKISKPRSLINALVPPPSTQLLFWRSCRYKRSLNKGKDQMPLFLIFLLFIYYCVLDYFQNIKINMKNSLKDILSTLCME